jgi:hypothetical protein
MWLAKINLMKGETVQLENGFFAGSSGFSDSEHLLVDL